MSSATIYVPINCCCISIRFSISLGKSPIQANLPPPPFSSPRYLDHHWSSPISWQHVIEPYSNRRNPSRLDEIHTGTIWSSGGRLYFSKTDEVYTHWFKTCVVLFGLRLHRRKYVRSHQNVLSAVHTCFNPWWWRLDWRVLGISLTLNVVFKISMFNASDWMLKLILEIIQFSPVHTK